MNLLNLLEAKTVGHPLRDTVESKMNVQMKKWPLYKDTGAALPFIQLSSQVCFSEKNRERKHKVVFNYNH